MNDFTEIMNKKRLFCKEWLKNNGCCDNCPIYEATKEDIFTCNSAMLEQPEKYARIISSLNTSKLESRETFLNKWLKHEEG